MKYIINSIIVLAAVSVTIHAKPNLPPPVEDFVKLEKMAGDPGAFTPKENFPKDYFLIPKNLPYLVGLSLYHPASSNLELTKKQIDALLKIKNEVTPSVAKKALKIKELELKLVHEIALKYKSKSAKDLDKIVDEIAKLQSELTKAHLRCIEKVKSILTKEQYEELLDYGVVNMF